MARHTQKTPRKQPARRAKAPAIRRDAPVRLNLALQGGGAHGAFTWGVLDRLLEDERIEIVGISGTSAGAMNGAMLVDGLREGGRARAREQLREFWWQISVEAGKLAPLSSPSHQDILSKIPGFDWLAALSNPMELLSHVFSPYELNPFNLNPLRGVLERLLSECNLQHGIPLFVTATNVETGEARVFREHEVTIEVLLASACLPLMYQAVEIEGVPYWDGGYMGNPSIWPLFYETNCADVLLVQINPLKRKGTPKTAFDIINRINEISFNSSLVAELRAINFVRRLLDEGKLSDREYANAHMHRVLPPEGIHDMNAASKMNANWDFLQELFLIGRDRMDAWLAAHRDAIGKHGTVSFQHDFVFSQPMRAATGQ